MYKFFNVFTILQLDIHPDSIEGFFPDLFPAFLNQIDVVHGKRTKSFFISGDGRLGPADPVPLSRQGVVGVVVLVVVVVVVDVVVAIVLVTVVVGGVAVVSSSRSS